MRLDVYPTVLNIPPEDELADCAAVVIDVLRATSTIVAALANGAEMVIPVLSPEEALFVARRNPERRFLLGGERNSVLIPGFDLSNSPREYTRDRVAQRSVLFTTTNGTRALRRAEGAGVVCIAALLNLSAVVQELASLGKDVAICCAGTHDQFSLEDTVCAGGILELMTRTCGRVETNDMGYVAQELFRRFDGRLEQLLHLSRHGQNLLKLGLQEDLRICSQVGTYGVVPRLNRGQIRL